MYKCTLIKYVHCTPRVHNNYTDPFVQIHKIKKKFKLHCTTVHLCTPYVDVHVCTNVQQLKKNLRKYLRLYCTTVQHLYNIMSYTSVHHTTKEN